MCKDLLDYMIDKNDELEDSKKVELKHLRSLASLLNKHGASYFKGNVGISIATKCLYGVMSEIGQSIATHYTAFYSLAFKTEYRWDHFEVIGDSEQKIKSLLALYLSILAEVSTLKRKMTMKEKSFLSSQVRFFTLSVESRDEFYNLKNLGKVFLNGEPLTYQQELIDNIENSSI